MQRQALDDGRWFIPKKARCWADETFWNGNNHISCATGSQWDHEELYRTSGGRWILHAWSQRRGSGERWVVISNDDAARWLVRNKYHDLDGVDDETAAAHAALEVS